MTEPKYTHGDKITLVTDETKAVRIITSYTVYPHGYVIYNCTLGAETSGHGEVEIEPVKEVEHKEAGFRVGSKHSEEGEKVI